MADIKFYGTRGTSSLTSEKYMEFGGATTCIIIKMNKTTIMVDVGSGVSNALDDLVNVEELHLFISHSHIDHISGIVTLLPVFKNKKLHIYAKNFNGIRIQESLNRIMSQSLWPISADTFKNVEFHEIVGDVKLNGITISNMNSNHPNECSLFRFKSDEADIVTAFDFCDKDGYDQKLIEFAKGCKTLIYDGTMSEDEVEVRPHWGHSSPEAGARIGEAIGVEQLYITHFGVFDDDTLTKWEAKLQQQYPFLSFARSGLHKSDFLKVLDIGALLNNEKDNDKLLTKIVEAAMDITKADGGTLYLLEDEQLEFKVLINKSKGTKQVRKELPIGIPAVKLSDKNVCATAGKQKQLINVEDCYSDSRYDFSGVQKYDSLNDYHTKSVLVAPLIDDKDDLIGVLQLINAKDNVGNTVSFSKSHESIISTMTNQAAMVIVRSLYSDKINDLLYGFVKVMSVGIDERTPYNANHTKNMIKFADWFFDYEEKENGQYKVDSIKRREILMSIWLHDTGKILTPLYIMNKDDRLGNLLPEVKTRFERRDLLLRLALANNKINQEQYQSLEEERASDYQTIIAINSTGFLNDELASKLDTIANKTYEELDGSVTPVLTKQEYYQLTIKKGTLTSEEREVMQNHVVMTQKLLAQLNFPKNYENIAIYAGNHHEFLNGSGYPNHLTEKDLPWPCRLITVLDIFEALVAKDRPYKKPMPTEKALSILHEMADEGKLDNSIIAEFEKAKPWLVNEQ